jgi:hypothetical protein
VPRLTAPSGAPAVWFVVSSSPHRLGQCRCLGGDADGVEHADRARGGRRAAERLEPVFRGVGWESLDHRDQIAGFGADQIAEHRRENVVVEEFVAQTHQPEQHLAPSVLVQMETRSGGATGDRRTDVDEVAVTVGAGAEHGVGEDDRVRLGPCDVLAEVGPRLELIRRTGPCRLAAHRFVERHQLPGCDSFVIGTLVEIGVEQVE